MAAEWTLRAVMLVAAGGAVGCVLRYLASVWFTRGDYPWGTLAVNLLGSFALAVLIFGGVARGTIGPDARVFLAAGLLGGFTTMSTFTYETVALVDHAGWLRAAAYALVTMAGSLGMAFAGRAVGLWLAT